MDWQELRERIGSCYRLMAGPTPTQALPLTASGAAAILAARHIRTPINLVIREFLTRLFPST